MITPFLTKRLTSSETFYNLISKQPYFQLTRVEIFFQSGDACTTIERNMTTNRLLGAMATCQAFETGSLS
jgi:hypothetical protein